jgi:hypothetical protein
MPRVRITVHAPADRSVEVVKSNSAWNIGALRASLIGNDGVRVPGGLPDDGTRPPRTSDFVRIEPGKESVIEEPVLTRVPAAGKFVVRIDLAAGPGGSQGFEADLALTCREILPSMVSRRYVVQGANEQEQLELLNVVDNGVCELVFRRTYSKYSRQIVTRLFEVDPNADVVAVFRSRLVDESESDEVWICWRKSRELWLGKLNTLSGRVLVTRPAFGENE